MEIPNYDSKNDAITANYKQLYTYMPQNHVRLLITGPSSCGKTNLISHLLQKPLLYFDKIYLYVKNLEQQKYQDLMKKIDAISKDVGYFIQSRHKNCSVIYLSQSFYKTPKDIRLNCSHFCIYDFPSMNECSLISRELNISKEAYHKAVEQPFSFLYVDKPMKKFKQNFYGEI